MATSGPSRSLQTKSHQASSPQTNSRQAKSSLRSGIRLGRVLGVDLVADWSLLLIFGLITINLGAGVFPTWHPEWSPLMCWALALLASALFFASVAVHELAHAVVGRKHGVPVRRITLFVFGGMAHMEGEPPSPKAEFLMTAVGPLTSIGIGIVATLAGVALSALSLDDAAASPATVLAAMSPGATLLLWLGPINLLLGVFNLIPGFPLDGGRLLRAGLWWATGDLRRATHWAAGAGMVVGWMLMGVGVAMALGAWIPGLGGGFVQGLWLVLIGWFLSNAARMSVYQLAIREALEGLSVRELMRRAPITVTPDLPVELLVRDYFLATDQYAFPVVEGGEIVGMVHLEDVRKVPRDERAQLRVADVMTPWAQLETVAPDEEATTALRQLARHEQIPVVEEGRLVGVARRQDFMKWLAFHEAPAH